MYENTKQLRLDLMTVKTQIGQIKYILNEVLMPVCLNKPPECYSGYNACLSCRYRKLCSIVYSKREQI